MLSTLNKVIALLLVGLTAEALGALIAGVHYYGSPRVFLLRVSAAGLEGLTPLAIVAVSTTIRKLPRQVDTA